MSVQPDYEPWMSRLSPKAARLMELYLRLELQQITHKALGGPLYSTLQVLAGQPGGATDGGVDADG